MWGIFDDGDISNNVSWAYRVDFVEPWHNQFNFLLATDVLSSKSSQQDLGAWVVADTAATTPLPGALPLFASGLGACGLLAWRRKRSRLATTAITT